MFMKNLTVLDLYCGLGGWSYGFVKNGISTTGYDILDFSKDYPGKFIKADLLKTDIKDHYDVIVASPPCTDFSKSSFPKTWKSVIRYPPDIEMAKKLFNRVYEIVDMVKPDYYIIENVRGSQKFMGVAKTHIGSRYFWGSYPDFFVYNRNDIYGKTNMPNCKNRPFLRSKIPVSISLSFANAVINSYE